MAGKLIKNRSSKRSGRRTESRTRRQLITMGSSVLLALLLVALATFLISRDGNSSTSVCKDESDIHSKASDAIQNYDSEMLKEINSQIERDPSYKYSPSCLYPLIRQSMDNKDDAKVRRYMTFFKSAVSEDKNKQIDSSYKGVGISNSEDIIKAVDAYFDSKEELDVNTIFIN